MSLHDRLRAEGLEHLGDVHLSSTLVCGDPRVLPLTPGPAWLGLATAPGTHVVFGRVWQDDPDLLEELVVVSASVFEGGRVDRFWDLYDDARDAGTCMLPSGRVAVLDGALRTDEATLKSLVEPEELPWVMERGFVAAAIRGGPARMFVGGGSTALLLSVALGPAPREMASSVPLTSEGSELA